MKFKPTITKTTISLLAGFLSGLIFALTYRTQIVCGITNCWNLNIPNELLALIILIFGTTFSIAIYLIWSLIEKK